MEESLSKARAALVKVKEDMVTYYNCRHEPAPIFMLGDKVYLDASDIHTTHSSKKLAHRHLGPYVIECQVGSCKVFTLLLQFSQFTNRT